MTTAREAKIEEILAAIDADAAAGWMSNWADVEETRTALIVTLADGTTLRYSIPIA